MYKIIPFNSGLNNQKMSILGCYLTSLREGRHCSLPTALYDYIPCTDNNTVPYADVFDDSLIINVVSQYSLMASSTEHSRILNPAEMFKVGAAAQRVDMLNQFERDFSVRLLKSFRASNHIKSIASGLTSAIQDALVLQLRVEKDWQNYLLSKLAFDNPLQLEDVIVDPDLIFNKIKSTELLSGYKKIYACCDEDDLGITIDDLKNIASKYGYELIFKSDLLGKGTFLPESRFIRSVVDFEVALNATAYVGLTRSTFSNTLSFVKNYGVDEKTNHFIYNIAGDACGLRCDDGLQIHPKLVVMKR